MDELTALLSHVMNNALGAGDVTNISRLTGGANMESSSFDFDGRSYVLRRAPSSEMMAGRPFGHDVEAAIIRAAYRSGVKAPEVVAELSPTDGLGTGFVMVRVEAEVNPVKILAAPPASLITTIAAELAKIHGIALADLPNIPAMNTATALGELKARFMTYGGDRPIIALAIKWLEDHLPAPAPLVLVHGDFRMGNLMVGPDGIAAVLDWELAHIGDAHEDLAWGCVNAWRFGHIELTAFGCATLESYFAAYQDAGGIAVDRERFRFWLIYRTLWWAMGCLQMGEIWRSGIDTSLERAVIGRRTSENEIDLLMLLEADAPETEKMQIALEPAPPPRRMGEPSQTELLEAIAGWIESDIKPAAKGRDRFMAAVAINAIGMLAREAAHPVAVHDAALSADLMSGACDLATPALLARLRRVALSKLANDVPKYSALEKARALWIRPE